MDTEPRYTQQSEKLTPAEAAARLGVSLDTLRRWVDEGRLSATRTLGNHRRFDRAEIEALAARREVAA